MKLIPSNKLVLRILLTLILIFYGHGALAYLDTTSKDFQKPEPIKSQAFEYKESKMDHYIDTAADKLSGSALGTMVTGPVGLIMKLGDKVIEQQEKSNKSQTLK